MRSAWGGFGRLAPVLAERERDVSLWGWFDTCIRRVLVCGGEARVLEQRTWVSWGRLGMVVRGMCGVSLRDGSAAVGIWCVEGRVRRVGVGVV